jgi:Flp pilus assembly pilin Flp
MLEYILIVVLIAIAGLAVWKVFGNRIRSLVKGSEQQITSVVDGGPCVKDGGGEGTWHCKGKTNLGAGTAEDCTCE